MIERPSYRWQGRDLRQQCIIDDAAGHAGHEPWGVVAVVGVGAHGDQHICDGDPVVG
jgi:hypothetical protein